MNQSSNLFILGEVARKLSIAPYRITYLLSTGRLKEPAFRLGNRRIFTEKDVERIAAAFEVNDQNERIPDNA